jgi:hypothetical protein
MSLIGWATGIAEQKLADDVPRRWDHVQGVAGKLEHSML